MEDFEQQLRNALARKQEPPAFEAKVFAAVAARKPVRSAFWHWAAEMAAVVLIAGGFWLRYNHDAQERIAGEAAKGRLQLALKITVTELSKIQRTVHASTEDE
jgi:Ni,Fe-hydrogenase I cytochrome b subunit